MARTTAANIAQIIARMTDQVRRSRTLVYSWGMGPNVAEDDAAARSMLALSLICGRCTDFAFGKLMKLPKSQ